MSTTVQTIDEVRAMLVEAIAVEAGVPADTVATDEPFTSYGLDSMAALSVGMEIEDTCGLKDLPVDLLWDHPTVDSLADALWALIQQQPVAEEV
ncbi:acyl carrier protein [Actinacidiphila guanduensis]|uniref:Phosphopantetheine attachment site n=1 Tax=Actinacidiphila guanduensis TaxID=310781 RepID=A0A1H0RV24_9ACTN|nr:acyl carrier protein [Actinacidiphila guanduensis]SDP33324.1 Phosphopantetheine attachment site [Actinacidiphila guanduensis]